MSAHRPVRGDVFEITARVLAVGAPDRTWDGRPCRAISTDQGAFRLSGRALGYADDDLVGFIVTLPWRHRDGIPTATTPPRARHARTRAWAAVGHSARRRTRATRAVAGSLQALDSHQGPR